MTPPGPNGAPHHDLDALEVRVSSNGGRSERLPSLHESKYCNLGKDFGVLYIAAPKEKTSEPPHREGLEIL